MFNNAAIRQALMQAVQQRGQGAITNQAAPVAQSQFPWRTMGRGGMLPQVGNAFLSQYQGATANMPYLTKRKGLFR